MTDQPAQPVSKESSASPVALSEADRLQYLQAMGIQPWFEKRGCAPEISSTENHPQPLLEEEPVSNEPVTSATRVTEEVPAQPINNKNIANLDWQQLRQAVSECQLCELHSSRTQTVFGVGDQDADLLIIGEAPGAEEDRRGEPFVGRAGKLLDAMLQAIQLDRQQVFIANVLKCRPPGNRDPRTSEIVCCDAYLQRQIELIQPKMILVLGRIAAHHLLMSQDSLGKLRQRQHNYNGIPLVVSYHPAYLLRNPVDKRKSWQDLLQVKKHLGR